MWGRRVATALVVSTLAASCGTAQRRDRGADAPLPSVVVGRQLLDQLPPTSSPTPSGQTTKDASFAMQLIDDNQGHPAGIPVKITGPVSRSVVSGADGYVRGTVPPGIYRFTVVEGCHDAVIVQEGGGGRAGVVEGWTTTGTLLVAWQHRFGPAPPVYNDVGGDWPLGRSVNLSFVVQDHCEQTPAPGKPISTYAFRTSANLRVAKPPSLRADSEGRSRVTVACTEAGAVSLDVYDTQNPADTIDLIQLVVGYDRVPRCARG